MCEHPGPRAEPSAAGDMARFTHNQASNTVQLESQLFNLVGQDLIKLATKVHLRRRDRRGYKGIYGGPRLRRPE